MRSACSQHAISMQSVGPVSSFWISALTCNLVLIRAQSESNQSSQNTCSSMVISGHQSPISLLRTPAPISTHQWSSVVISGHQWSSAISLLRTPAPNDAPSPPPSVVISGHYWSLEALTCSQRRSLSASSAASRSRRTSDSINERIASESRAYAADSCAVVPTRVVVRVAPPSLFGLPPSAAAAAAASSAPASGAAASSSSTVVGGGLMHASRLSRLGSS